MFYHQIATNKMEEAVKFSRTDFQNLLGSQLELAEPDDFKCGGDKTVTRMCVSPECSNFSIMCDGYGCHSCGYQSHQLCRFVRMNAITKLLTEIVGRQKEFNLSISKIDAKLIDQLERDGVQLCKKYYMGDLEEKYLKTIEQIYVNRNERCLVGVEAKEFYKRLVKSHEQMNRHGSALLEDYETAVQKLTQEILDLKSKLFQSFAKGLELEAPSKLGIDSQIIKRCLAPTKEDIRYYNSMIQQQLEFIKESLGSHKSLELIFRGSEHGFRASAFHNTCGNIDNTLTLIRTEYGKTIAAFTPYAWHSVPHGSYVKDQAEGTFILALDHMQRLDPFDPNKLIYNHSGYGPTFGGGHDLRVGDQCDTNNNSWAGCITSYNTADERYQNNQSTYKAISGVASGCNFRIVEYEVFKVVREASP